MKCGAVHSTIQGLTADTLSKMTRSMPATCEEPATPSPSCTTPNLISKLSGCKLPVSESLPDHCGPGGGVTLTWEIEGDSLTFSGDAGGS